MRSWGNWQTRQVEGLVRAILCQFKSDRPHQIDRQYNIHIGGGDDFSVLIVY